VISERGSLAAICLVGAFLGQSCGGCICSPYPFYTAVTLTSRDANTVVPLGAYQTLGVLLPGSDRQIDTSDSKRLIPYHPTVDQPPDMTFAEFSPTGATPPFGGKVEISASAQGGNPRWHVTVMLGTDPQSDGWPAGYIGSGTMLLAPGQSFVMSWPVGADAPTSTDPTVLAAVGEAMPVHSEYEAGPDYRFIVYKTFNQQLFLAAGSGTAQLAAVSALPPRCNSEPGPGCSTIPVGCSETIRVIDDAGWQCSLDRGCVPLKGIAAQRPGGYQPPPATNLLGSPSPCG